MEKKKYTVEGITIFYFLLQMNSYIQSIFALENTALKTSTSHHTLKNRIVEAVTKIATTRSVPEQQINSQQIKLSRVLSRKKLRNNSALSKRENYCEDISRSGLSAATRSRHEKSQRFHY